MAFVGLRKPFVAKYDKATKQYSDGFRYSHAVSLSINPNYAEASLYGDDAQQEYEKSFTNATISLGTTSTPIQAASVMFGHKVEGKKVTFKATDEANYVGMGIIAPERVDGVSQFVALIVLCAKFADSNEQYQTKGDQLQFNTPTIEGSAISADDDANWKVTEIFDKEEDAEAFIKEYLNIVDSYTVTQNLTNVTSDYTKQAVNTGEQVEANLTADSGYELGDVTVMMGGEDITATAYSAGKVTIASATGDIVITAAATRITHSVTQNLTNVTSDYSGTSVNDGDALEATLTEDS